MPADSWNSYDRGQQAQTIRTWTGLTDDRIRNLHSSYMSLALIKNNRAAGRAQDLADIQAIEVKQD